MAATTRSQNLRRSRASSPNDQTSACARAKKYLMLVGICLTVVYMFSDVEEASPQTVEMKTPSNFLRGYPAGTGTNGNGGEEYVLPPLDYQGTGTGAPPLPPLPPPYGGENNYNNYNDNINNNNNNNNNNADVQYRYDGSPMDGPSLGGGGGPAPPYGDAAQALEEAVGAAKADMVVAERAEVSTDERDVLDEPVRKAGEVLGRLFAEATLPSEWALEAVDHLRTELDEALNEAATRYEAQGEDEVDAVVVGDREVFADPTNIRKDLGDVEPLLIEEMTARIDFFAAALSDSIPARLSRIVYAMKGRYESVGMGAVQGMPWQGYEDLEQRLRDGMKALTAEASTSTSTSTPITEEVVLVPGEEEPGVRVPMPVHDNTTVGATTMETESPPLLTEDGQEGMIQDNQNETYSVEDDDDDTDDDTVLFIVNGTLEDSSNSTLLNNETETVLQNTTIQNMDVEVEHIPGITSTNATQPIPTKTNTTIIEKKKPLKNSLNATAKQMTKVAKVTDTDNTGTDTNTDSTEKGGPNNKQKVPKRNKDNNPKMNKPKESKSGRHRRRRRL